MHPSELRVVTLGLPPQTMRPAPPDSVDAERNWNGPFCTLLIWQCGYPDANRLKSHLHSSRTDCAEQAIHFLSFYKQRKSTHCKIAVVRNLACIRDSKNESHHSEVMSFLINNSQRGVE